MSLINCPECNKEISDKAEACIGCGYPIASNDNTTHKKANYSPLPPPFSQPPATYQSSYNTYSTYSGQQAYQGQAPFQQNYAPSQEIYYQQVLQQNMYAAEKAANASIACGIIGFFIAGLILGIIAIAQGNKAKSLGYVGGKASAGIVLGVIDVVAWAFIIIYWFL